MKKIMYPACRGETKHNGRTSSGRTRWQEHSPTTFLGYSNLNDAQKADRAKVFDNVSTVDYVACWYVKASEYTRGHHIRTALVSTNSICRGQQVKPTWDRMFTEGNHIDFA